MNILTFSKIITINGVGSIVTCSNNMNVGTAYYTTASYKNNENVGTAIVLISGKRNYIGTVTKHLKLILKERF